MGGRKGIAAKGIDPKPPTCPRRDDMPLVAMLLILLLTLTACSSQRQRVETLAVAQRQERQLSLSDTLWQQFSIRFDDLVVEWWADSLPAEGGSSATVRLKAARAEVSREQQSATTLVAVAQRTDTVSRQREEITSEGIAVPEPVEGPRHRYWLWIVPLLVLLLCAGFFLLKKRYGWPL